MSDTLYELVMAQQKKEQEQLMSFNDKRAQLARLYADVKTLTKNKPNARFNEVAPTIEQFLNSQ